MNAFMLRAYHALPAPGRSLAASAWGWRLRRLRYDATTDARVEAALERDRWSPARIRAYQEERLAYVLHRAATRVPYYRELWARRRAQGDRRPWDVLANWPILEKAVLRERPHAFLADDCDPRRMVQEHTSGTTGSPLRLWWSRETVVAWYALFEARWRRWYGVSRADRWAIVGGQLVAPVGRGGSFWVWNAGLRQLYVSAYHLGPATVAACLDALRRYDVRYLLGYPSALHVLATEALRQGLRVPRLAVVIGNAEPILAPQRAALEAAFGCPVRETYGMAEIVAAASECEAGRLHLWPEAGIVEVLEGETPVAEGAAGDLVCTGLLNADMPLVRYRVGDRGALGRADESCGCGRALAMLASVEGRRDDVIVTPDGRRLGRLDPVFKGDLPIREAQIVQDRHDRVCVRYVPLPGFGDRDAASLRERLADRLGDMEIVLEAVDAIPRTSAGKFRAVVNRVGAEGAPVGGRDV